MKKVKSKVSKKQKAQPTERKRAPKELLDEIIFDLFAAEREEDRDILILRTKDEPTYWGELQKLAREAGLVSVEYGALLLAAAPFSLSNRKPIPAGVGFPGLPDFVLNDRMNAETVKAFSLFKKGIESLERFSPWLKNSNIPLDTILSECDKEARRYNGEYFVRIGVTLLNHSKFVVLLSLRGEKLKKYRRRKDRVADVIKNHLKVLKGETKTPWADLADRIDELKIRGRDGKKCVDGWRGLINRRK